jgi:glucose/mannose transport system substrate-binding protein
MAESGAVKGAIFDVIARFYNDKSMTPEAAAKQMASQAKQAHMMSQM